MRVSFACMLADVDYGANAPVPRRRAPAGPGHGTFQLGDDGIDAPKQLLRECAAPDSFLVLDNGESVALE